MVASKRQHVLHEVAQEALQRDVSAGAGEMHVVYADFLGEGVETMFRGPGDRVVCPC